MVQCSKDYLCLCNATLHGNQPKSPFELETSRKPQLCFLRVFGCRVFVLPPRPTTQRSNKLVPGSITGLFLGFAKSMQNILSYGLETTSVKEAL